MQKDFEKTENALLTREFILSKVFIFWSLLTFVGLLFTGSSYISRGANNPEYTIFNALNDQMVRFQVWTVFSLLIIWFDHQIGLRFKSWRILFPVHLGAAILWSLITTTTYFVISWTFEGIFTGGFLSLADTFRTAFVPNFVIGIFGYKIILTTNIALDYYKRFELEKKHSADLQNQLAQAQLQALKMQLQPHFLFNTLNSVSNLTLEDPRGAVQMIARLGDFLRLTINTNGNQKVTLENELDFLKHYLEIEKMRFRDRLKVDFEVEQSVAKAIVPNLILQPLVENAIKHGISKSLSAGKIKFSACRIDSNLRIEIENDGAKVNGAGFGSKGVGLANTRSRLEQLYRDDFSFDLIALEAGGARVILEIPYTEDK